MARKVAFKQADVSRAVKGAVGAGLAISRVEIDQEGRIVLVATSDTKAPENPLDAWMAKNAAR